MSADAINSIKQAEGKAEDIKRQAVLSAREIIFEAERESDELLRKVSKHTSVKRHELFEAAEVEAKAQIKLLAEDYERQGRAISEAASKRMREAVSLIVGKVVGSSGDR